VSGEAAWAAQSGFGVRLCWGTAGVTALADEVAALVLVDVLRFTTSLDVATAAGGVVHPAPWPLDRAQLPAGLAEVADGSGPRALSLSPASLAVLSPGDAIVLPSPNGSHCSTVAATVCMTVVGGCLRNAGAVARWVDDAAEGGAVGVVPCGESWPGGGLRPAVEDLLGAGAIVSELAGERSCSPEAAAALAAFRTARPEIASTLAESASGRGLRDRGLEDDVAWAGAVDVSECVPVLGSDGAYRAVRPAWQGREPNRRP
jgi:2-phosphosulfolactate phosphatase